MKSIISAAMFGFIGLTGVAAATPAMAIPTAYLSDDEGGGVGGGDRDGGHNGLNSMTLVDPVQDQSAGPVGDLLGTAEDTAGGR